MLRFKLATLTISRDSIRMEQPPGVPTLHFTYSKLPGQDQIELHFIWYTPEEHQRLFCSGDPDLPTNPLEEEERGNLIGRGLEEEVALGSRAEHSRYRAEAHEQLRNTIEEVFRQAYEKLETLKRRWEEEHASERTESSEQGNDGSSVFSLDQDREQGSNQGNNG